MMTATTPRSTAHIVVAALLGWGASAAGFVVVAIAAAVLSGRTIAGGERAVIGAAIADLAIVIAAIAGLAYYARNATPLARWLSVAALAIAEFATAAVMLVMTIVLLNR